jgi:hypothetical protein
LNAILLSWLIWSHAAGRIKQAPIGAPVKVQQDNGPRLVSEINKAVPAVLAKNASSFRWAEVESSDYHVYINNLRGIGCPEQTIWDIITADLHALYGVRRQKIETALAAGASGRARATLQGELQSLSEEENEALSELFGSEPKIAVQEVNQEDGQPKNDSAERESPVSMPLAFANVDVSSLNLDESQKQVIGSLRRRFLSEIGGPDQDPNDPAYLERWQKAQPKLDEMMRGMIGINAYQQYDLAARVSRGKQAAGTP